jgi:DNA-binding CsgD family transcriptional regulator
MHAFVVPMQDTRFGQWTVIRFIPPAERGAFGIKTRRAYWLCRCDCGAEKPVQGARLRGGHSWRCQKCGMAHAQRALAVARRLRPRVPQPPRYNYTPVDWSRLGDRVLEMRAAGRSTRLIGLELGITRNSVIGWLYRNAPYAPHHGSTLIPPDDPELLLPPHFRDRRTVPA